MARSFEPKILLTDDHDLLRESVEAFVEREMGLEALTRAYRR